MATKIFDVELSEASAPQAGLENYDHALFLLRQDGRPVGKVTVAVRDGAVDPRELRRAISMETVVAASHIIAAGRLPLPPPPKLPTVSVAVCTRERPDDLRRALTSLVSQTPQAKDILVVDNCPATDATRAVVEEFTGVRYVCEPRKGLDNARNRAIAESNAEVVAFIDDDAVADPGWLTALVRPFADSRVHCVTGLTMPLELETEAQEKFETLSGFSRRGFVKREFRSPPVNPLATGNIGAGANMAIRRNVVDSVGRFDPALDAGTVTQSGGDHEFFSRILRAGHTIVYEPAALNWHRHRRTPAELRQAIFGYGVGIYASWTRSFLVERDWGVFRRALGWLVREQIPRLISSYFRPSKDWPRQLLWAELQGCLRGPSAYLVARRTARKEGHE